MQLHHAYILTYIHTVRRTTTERMYGAVHDIMPPALTYRILYVVPAVAVREASADMIFYFTELLVLLPSKEAFSQCAHVCQQRTRTEYTTNGPAGVVSYLRHHFLRFLQFLFCWPALCRLANHCGGIHEQMAHACARVACASMGCGVCRHPPSHTLTHPTTTYRTVPRGVFRWALFQLLHVPRKRGAIFTVAWMLFFILKGVAIAP